MAIPLISNEPYHSLIAQARNGSGKTGAFAIGSVLRVDTSDPKVQVLCIVNVRELCNQVHEVYAKITKGSEVSLSNFMDKDVKPAQVIVTTHGKLE